MSQINTLLFYEAEAIRFFAETASVDMRDLYEQFLPSIPEGGLILDAGCGSGRDSKAFISRGYRVSAFDASSKLVEMAGEFIGQPVSLRTFHEVSELACYDGIWACASLLHLRETELPGALIKLWAALKPGGTLYASFKIGDGERSQQGRHFTDANEPRVNTWLADLVEIAEKKFWITVDQRPGKTGQWLNALIKRQISPAVKLVIGGRQHPFLPQLSQAIAHADEIDMTVAFIKTSGLRLLMPDLQAAQNQSTPDRPLRLRILTSDYLDVTDPEALRLLILLKEQGAQIKVYESAGSSFHMKAYLFAHFKDGHLHGTAFIGSSNISRQALTDGLEWNYRIDYPGDDGFIEARSRFDSLFANPRCAPLTDDWISKYEARRQPLKLTVGSGGDDNDPPPEATSVQQAALTALQNTRKNGFRRGLVVMATGLGKTWLAAFDAQQMGEARVLFVAHREEILTQAAATFLRIRPQAKVGFYTGRQRDSEVDTLCASIQTLGRSNHLSTFPARHFDYIVVDEFHHAAAPLYRRLLKHFTPRFLLGLTATPDRTDQSDILSLCDDNLVFTKNLFEGISERFLAPFHYFGILDESVNYLDIPWRNGKFDPDQLSNKLATLARARHVLQQWRERAQQRTLAFCVSKRHAEFMAEQFRLAGISAAPVYSGSEIARGKALQQLADGELAVIFSVDLFNEGVDLPSIDTVMMLRPTESKILFLQQLGRGLRQSQGKNQLIVLDFIANHRSFLHKPQALFGLEAGYQALGEFARKLENNRLPLPAGCYINYDLRFIDFLKSLSGNEVEEEYKALRDVLGRRPSLSEFFRSGAAISRVRQQYGNWFSLLDIMRDLPSIESEIARKQQSFLLEVETTAMTKSFKMILLEAFQELDGWLVAPSISTLAQRSWELLHRRPPLLADLSRDMRAISRDSVQWERYWQDNPIKAWTSGKVSNEDKSFFSLKEGQLHANFVVTPEEIETFSSLVQELIDYRLAAYDNRTSASRTQAEIIPFPSPNKRAGVELPFFEDLRIACGHFRHSTAEVVAHRPLPISYGQLDPARFFIARASGNSMNGGKHPICDGDFLLLELLTAGNAGSITGSVMAIERQDEFGDNQYLLRVVTKSKDGQYILKANNPDYADLAANDEMRTLARFKQVIDPLDLVIGEPFMREDIPQLFGEEFNPGNWHSGHIALNQQNAHVLLVTLNKQGKVDDHRYVDHWIDERNFHWQSQNATTPESKKGRELIEHLKERRAIHLFVRENKLSGGKAAPFTYFGQVHYRSHLGSQPMSVIFELQNQ